MESLKIYGKATETEIHLNLFNDQSIELNLEGYLEEVKLIFPDEELVMLIAENWSVNPSGHSERTVIKK